MSSQSSVPAINGAVPHRTAHVSGRRDRIWVTGLVISVCFQIALLVLLNAYPERIGVLISADDPASFVPLLGPEFRLAVPWLNAWLGLALALSFVHLSTRRWTSTTRWADLGLNAFGCAILWHMATAGPLVAASPAWTTAGRPLLQVGPAVVSVLTLSFEVGLWVIFGIAVLTTGLKFLKLLASL